MNDSFHTIVHTEEHANCTINIVLDPEPLNPREEYENLGTMACWHRNYILGDEKRGDRTCDKGEPEEYLLDLARKAVSPNYPEALLVKNQHAILAKHYVILPLYLHDHSGLSISTGAFSCPWDSGQVGFIYCDLAAARANHALPNATWKTQVKWQDKEGKIGTVTLREHTERVLKGEVNTYDQYLTGQVYGYEVSHDETGKEESCWGFYQDENAGAEDSYVLVQARDIAEHLDKQANKEAAEVAIWAARDCVTVPV